MSTALLIIDVQSDLCTGDNACFDIDNVLQRINGMSRAARAAGVPVVLVQHEDDDLQYGSAGSQLETRLLTDSADLTVRKTTPDSFLRTGLAELLHQVVDVIDVELFRRVAEIAFEQSFAYVQALTLRQLLVPCRRPVFARETALRIGFRGLPAQGVVLEIGRDRTLAHELPTRRDDFADQARTLPAEHCRGGLELIKQHMQRAERSKMRIGVLSG